MKPDPEAYYRKESKLDPQTYQKGIYAIKQLVSIIGDDPDRQGLQCTPDRVLRSYEELFSGYNQTVADLFTVFEDPTSEMVILKGIEMYSTCEHHMLPFYGVAHVAYIPNGKVIGISKLARILEAYSRRLQIQERICDQVTSALMQHLNPRGAACLIEAKHFCTCSRGVNKQHSMMVTSSLKGVFLEPEVRQEFLSLVK